MRSILSLIALVTVAYVAQAQTTVTGLRDIYSKFCIGKAYAADGTKPAFTAYEPWEFMKGYALGSQNDISDTKSTCYEQVV